MFTEYTREEMESPLQVKAEGPDGESYKAEDMPDEGVGYKVNDSVYDTKEYDNNDHFPYELDGESLW